MSAPAVEAPRAVRTIVTVPAAARAGDVIEIRALIAHPMETGHRSDGAGGVVPRDVLRRFSCRLDGELVFAVELHPAIAANPLLAFHLRVQKPGTLAFTWEGDRGFRHTETAPLRVG
ncbi:MAG: thiosulfate oxidation carrier complex protein SoxZ [Rubrivivax sp.]